MNIATLEIRQLGPDNEDALVRLFERIAVDAARAHFHPHPFTATEARRIVRLNSHDVYLCLGCATELVGYGMLRGWDEGYAVPRLGIYLLPEMRRTGAAGLLMRHLHETARSRGARVVQLTVYSDNTPAVRLFRSMGYVFEAEPLPDGRIVGNLALCESCRDQTNQGTGK